MANLLAALLREAHLPLNRVSATYANRILTFDFCKYERAARNILEDTVRPWHERVKGRWSEVGIITPRALTS